DLDSNSVLWRDQRRPGPSHVRLPSHSEHEPIHHFMHHAGVYLVILDRISIMDGVHNRRRGSRLLGLAFHRRDGAKENESDVSHQHEGVNGRPSLWVTTQITTLARLTVIVRDGEAIRKPNATFSPISAAASLWCAKWTRLFAPLCGQDWIDDTTFIFLP